MSIKDDLDRGTGSDRASRDDRYKWVALTNTTVGVLLATIDASIMLIAMPDIFRGIQLDPLLPENSFYLLWMILGYLVTSSVLVVSVGRLGDLFGRVKMYNLGFVVYTFASLMLTITWMTGHAGAIWLLVWRIVQGIGGAFLVGNSGAILTDAFPAHQRGLALGINNVAGISGTFIGLVLGGLLAPVNWRLVFLISVPCGVFGAVWAYRRLRDVGTRSHEPVDWLGNVTFAAGLILVMIGITHGIQPYGAHTMGWTSPLVLGSLAAGVVLLLAFAAIERRVRFPMFRLPLFRIRAFTFGTLSTFLSALGRGGLMFMMIIWLQGIWLPLHGYTFEETPLWAGIHMLPLTVGFLAAGPVSGYLSDRFGARPFATGGMIVAAVTFGLLELLPIDFPYWQFAGILLLNGLAMGCFASPNRAAVMNSLPAADRGAGGGMNSTFQNSAQVFSIGIFFSLMIAGLAATLPSALTSGLEAHHVPAAAATAIASSPPVSVLFAAFLGYNPMQHLLGDAVLAQMPPVDVAAVTGNTFFPDLISGPFEAGLHIAFGFAIAACLIAAAASVSRGTRYVAADRSTTPATAPEH
ncbi:major facilitator superfamily MFS_1 [Pseudonocardia dioxanivorans CB1190]|uniref:Major facilitator superfamily MFS_1 n=1 Tax=Pseudonocardia dioxanivorans (strain ATCC 55486 / DSM 44775 / JCM 13855 / CB1190) TaxID=675635 RepID=F4D1S9_PSEUX|nr:MFS transporter [Pseudonocardia dioxanivorans]AEA27989.1 major facilitator superfamily MFS_1 [Pseudonocardia dioxanivorans CB1190]